MEAYCPYCKEWSFVRVVDNGVGPIEVWGSVKSVPDLEVETFCCGSIGYFDENCLHEVTVKDVRRYKEC